MTPVTWHLCSITNLANTKKSIYKKNTTTVYDVLAYIVRLHGNCYTTQKQSYKSIFAHI